MRRRLLLVILCGLALGACAEVPREEAPETTQTLLPYSSATPSPRIADVQDTPEPPTAQPVTPTPWVHRVQADDTLLGIASRYGVELADLLASNPEVDPNFLTIDMEIVIPVEGVLQEALSSTATPFPLPSGDVNCYQTFGNELWCFSAVENTSEQQMEGLAVRIRLRDSSGGILTGRTAYAPLNLLPAGSTMPVAAGFMLDDAAGWAAADAELVSGFPVNEAEDRYVPLSVEEEKAEYSSNRTGVSWEGTVSLQGEDIDKDVRASLLLTAYDEDDSVVGYRKIELSDLAAGSSVQVQTRVYSPGPSIERLEILAEAVYILE